MRSIAWPALEDPENGIETAEQLFRWAKEHGYDALEMGVDDFKRKFWPRAPVAEVITRVRELCARYDMPAVGALYHVVDGDWDGMRKRVHADGSAFDLDVSSEGEGEGESGGFYGALRQKLLREREIGLEYVDVHLRLPRRYVGTGGEYRGDGAYIARTARRVARIQRVCHELGLNVYFETHVNMVSEDPEAFCSIMDACPLRFEVNLDVSHLSFRGIVNPDCTHLRRIEERVGHTHQRMSRAFGDLSVDVADPEADWARRGFTYQAFANSRRALRGGLSSRCVGGESGPIQAGGLAVGTVQNALELDAKLVPLYRAMARYADAMVDAEDEALAPAANPFRDQRGGGGGSGGGGNGAGPAAAGAAQERELARQVAELERRVRKLAK
eukprot:g5466.t1